jgi:hypothetical protein
MNLITTVAAFLLTLGVLIVIHELGHYWVARWSGVKVLRFSIGFGRPIARWVRGPDRTEWVVSVLPLGGYVRMLDERDPRPGPSKTPSCRRVQPPVCRQALRDRHRRAHRQSAAGDICLLAAQRDRRVRAAQRSLAARRHRRCAFRSCRRRHRDRRRRHRGAFLE